jgi:Chaperone of endosialidase
MVSFENGFSVCATFFRRADGANEKWFRPNEIESILKANAASGVRWSLVSTKARTIGPISLEQDLDLAQTHILGASSPLSDLAIAGKSPGERTTRMDSTTKIIKTISLIGAFALFVFSPTARAVDPPPDGGYPDFNTAEGEDALFSLTIGDNNTAVGFHALFSDINGDNNTAVGWFALQHNTGGLANTATGADALGNNTTGDANAAVGAFALFNNSTGIRNTAIGVESLKRNNGSNNVAIGYEAGMNIGIGSNNICIGHMGVTSDTDTIRIGMTGVQTTTFVAGVSGATVPAGVGVIVDANGHLGTVVSSQRFKDNVQPMDKASEAILSLQPVTFHYKKELDPAGIPQFGLVAEQVEKVNPDLVARDDQGKPYTVRYEAVNAMLLNEFLKEHRKVEEQARINREQEAMIAELKSALKEQAAQIQKVGDLVQMQKASPSFAEYRR